MRAVSESPASFICAYGVAMVCVVCVPTDVGLGAWSKSWLPVRGTLLRGT